MDIWKEPMKLFIICFVVLIKDVLLDQVDEKTIISAKILAKWTDADFVLFVAGANPTELSEVRKMALEALPTKEQLHIAVGEVAGNGYSGNGSGKS